MGQAVPPGRSRGRGRAQTRPALSLRCRMAGRRRRLGQYQGPADFGFLRSRWCCEVVALLMLRLYHLDVSRETIRRWLHRGEMVYRRPRPVPKPDEEERRVKLAELRQLLAELPDDETAVFQDEVDINTNPKIGSMWMFKGQQAKVETPGDNEKRYLAGSIHWRSGQVSSPRASRSRVGMRPCSWPTSTTCGTGCGGTRRSTSSATMPSSTGARR